MAGLAGVGSRPLAHLHRQLTRLSWRRSCRPAVPPACRAEAVPPYWIWLAAIGSRGSSRWIWSTSSLRR